MEPKKKLNKNAIVKIFTANKKKWKVINFKKRVRGKSVAQYRINFTGKT